MACSMACSDLPWITENNGQYATDSAYISAACVRDSLFFIVLVVWQAVNTGHTINIGYKNQSTS